MTAQKITPFLWFDGNAEARRRRKSTSCGALGAGGSEEQCGWLKDKFGLSWQIIPSILGSLLSDKDPAKANKAMQAMLQMKEIDIAKLKQAHAGT